MKPFRGQPQQLTLFKAPKPTDQHRWPEGYSPERRQAVQDNVEVIQRSYRPGTRYGDPRGQGDSMINPKPGVGMKNVISDIARSSVPTEHLHNPFYPERRLQVHVRDEIGGGMYFGPGHGKIGVGPDVAPYVTLHEIGHAASDITGQRHASGNRDAEHQRLWRAGKDEAARTRAAVRDMGHEEAFADNYSRSNLGARRGETPDRGVRSIYEMGGEGWQHSYPYLTRPQATMAHKTYMNDRQFAATPPPRQHPVIESILRERQYGRQQRFEGM